MKKTPMARMSLSRLIENDMAQGEDAMTVVMASRAIADKLQDMAQKAAEIIPKDVMPMLDNIKQTFGPQVSERFNTAVTAKCNELVAALMAAKDGIDTEIGNLDKAANGENTTDMALDDPAELDMGDDAGSPPAMPPEGDVDPEADLGAEGDAPPAPPAEGDDADPMGGFGDDMGGAAGRAKKESAQVRGRRIAETRNISRLRNAKNPDAMVLSTFRNFIAEGAAPARALAMTSRGYGIDASDVLSLIKEAKAKKKVPPAFLKNMKKKKSVKEDNNFGASDKPQAAYGPKGNQNKNANGQTDDDTDDQDGDASKAPKPSGSSSSTTKSQDPAAMKAAKAAKDKDGITMPGKVMNNAPKAPAQQGGPLNPRDTEVVKETAKKTARTPARKPTK